MSLHETKAPHFAFSAQSLKGANCTGERLMINDLEACRRRVAEYGATRGQPGFNKHKLHEMVSGCAHRQELLRTDLTTGEAKMLRKLIERERRDLWS
jgi:hypothetical protein